MTGCIKEEKLIDKDKPKEDKSKEESELDKELESKDNIEKIIDKMTLDEKK